MGVSSLCRDRTPWSFNSEIVELGKIIGRNTLHAPNKAYGQAIGNSRSTHAPKRNLTARSSRLGGSIISSIKCFKCAADLNLSSLFNAVSYMKSKTFIDKFSCWNRRIDLVMYVFECCISYPPSFPCCITLVYYFTIKEMRKGPMS